MMWYILVSALPIFTWNSFNKYANIAMPIVMVAGSVASLLPMVTLPLIGGSRSLPKQMPQEMTMSNMAAPQVATPMQVAPRSAQQQNAPVGAHPKQNTQQGAPGHTVIQQ